MGNEFDYEMVKRLCRKFLIKELHEKHLEDCVQTVSLLWFEGRTNIKWNVIEYCRQSGIGRRGKLSAKTLETATFVGLSDDESEDVKENGFLFDEKATELHAEQEERPTFHGILEEFLLPVGFKKETREWILKNYRPPQYRTKGKTFNTYPNSLK